LPRAYKLPESLRSGLAKPMGRLFTADEVKGREFAELVRQAEMVITVGDRVTDTVGAMGRPPDVQVVDAKENRKGREPPAVPYARLIRASNPAGALSEEVVEAVRSALGGEMPARVLVEGEEDLVAIPVIAMAPSSAVVLYGQPGEGIVAVKPDPRTKARNRSILNQMGFPGNL
jgi:GTP-dependent dephospho-CoA kinase